MNCNYCLLNNLSNLSEERASYLGGNNTTSDMLVFSASPFKS